MDRVRVVKSEDLSPKRQRKPANRRQFSDLTIKRIRPPQNGQELYWDSVQKGLALLVSSGGTKTFRGQFKLKGKWITRSLGRFGEIVTDDGFEEDANVA